MSTNYKQYPNIRTDVVRLKGNATQKSNLRYMEYFDCININGPVDNSGCSASNSLCNCPCTGGDETASAVPLFREPTDDEMRWAKTALSRCQENGDRYDGYFTINPDSLTSNCGVQCHGDYFYNLYQVSRTYSSFWKTPKKTPLYRNALINLYTTEQAVCIIPGNLNIKVGDFIFFPSDETPINQKYNGGWLISHITHAIPTLQQYKMILTLIRDSKIDYPEGYEDG